MNTRTYQWFVARGRIAVTSDANCVILEIDPEGSACCVMTAQDASEIAGFITEHARTLWEASNNVPEPEASVTEDSPRSYRLRSQSGVLALAIHQTKPLIGVTFEGSAQCVLTVTQAVALVQLIGNLLANISRAPLENGA